MLNKISRLYVPASIIASALFLFYGFMMEWNITLLLLLGITLSYAIWRLWWRVEHKLDSPPSIATMLDRLLARLSRVISKYPATVFLVWSLWLATPYFIFGPNSYVRIHDVGDSTLPVLIALKLKATPSIFNFWSSQALTGYDRYAVGFTKILHALFFYRIPGWIAYAFIAWLQRFIAGYFTFRLLTDITKTRRLPALFAGLAFSLFFQPTINNSWTGFALYDAFGLPAIPLLILAMYGLTKLRSKSLPVVYAIGLGAIFSLATPYSFGAFILLCVLCWFVFIAPAFTRKQLVLLAVFLFSYSLATLPFLAIGKANWPISHRIFWPVEMNRQQAIAALSFAANLIKDNVVPLTFVLFGLLFKRNKDYLLRITAVMVVFLAVIALYPILQFAAIKYARMPPGFQWNRAYIFLPFLFAVAGALGLDRIMEEIDRFKAPKISMLLGLLAVLLILFQSINFANRINMEMATGSTYASLYEQPDMKMLANTYQHSKPFRVATIASNKLHPAYAWAYGLDTVDGYVPMYSRRYQEYWGQVIRPVLEENKWLHDYFYNWGSRVYLFPPTSDRLKFSDCYNLKLLSLANTRFIISPSPLSDPNLALLPSANHNKTKPIYIYENARVFNRFFLVHHSVVLRDTAAVLESLSKATYEQLALNAYISKTEIVPSLIQVFPANNEKVNVRMLSEDSVVLNTHINSRAILISTINYSPSWKAEIDGANSPVFPVDHCFIGVVVNPGNHTIRLSYSPKYRCFGTP